MHPTLPGKQRKRIDRVVLGMFLILAWYLFEFLLHAAHYLFSFWVLDQPSPTSNEVFFRQWDAHFQLVFKGLRVVGWASVSSIPLFLLGLYWAIRPLSKERIAGFPTALALGAFSGVTLIFTKTCLNLSFLTNMDFVPHDLFFLLQRIAGSMFLAVGFIYLARIFYILGDRTFSILSGCTGAYVVLIPLALWIATRLDYQFAPQYSVSPTAPTTGSVLPPAALWPLVLAISKFLAFGSTTLILFQFKWKLVRKLLRAGQI